MSKRPKDSPFGALADIRHKVRSAAPASSKPAPGARAATLATTPAGSPEEDEATFRAAVSGVAPLAPSRHANLERPRPAPVPLKRTPDTDLIEPARPVRRIDPNDPAALFQEAMNGVVPLPERGLADLGKRTPRRQLHRIHHDGDSPARALPELILAVDENDPQALFHHVVGDAAPLPNRNLAVVEKPLPPPLPRQHEADEAAALRESIDAPLSFQDRLDTGDESVYLHDGVPRRALADLRRGRWVIQDELDLHGLTREEARSALADFLAQALARGLRCIRLIHGKGLGSPGREPVLKHLSRGWLMQRAEILAFCQAKPHDGGEGALLVLLRNQNKTG
jgi:DNA-nicking Smr family endonuclease